MMASEFRVCPVASASSTAQTKLAVAAVGPPTSPGTWLVRRRQSEYHGRTGKLGGVAERLKAPVLKTGIPLNGERGFESHPLRHPPLSHSVQFGLIGPESPLSQLRSRP